jgi:S1-C subfamily serine protease
MKTHIAWIPVAAAVAILPLHGVGEEKPCLEGRVVTHASAQPDGKIEQIALELLLQKHAPELSEIEKGALSSAVSRLESAKREPVSTPCTDLGVSIAPIDEAVRRHIEPRIEGGLAVTGVTADGLLSFWGVEQHDLIVSANGKPLHNARALQEVLDGAVEGTKPVLLEVIVQGNRRTLNLLPLRNQEKLKAGAPRFWQFAGC